MPSLKDIRNRIVSVKNTQQITKAMKMVAAAKLRRAQEAIEQARAYSEKLNGIVSNLSQGIDESAHPLLATRDGGKTIFVVVSSDRGLCGGLNNNLFKALRAFHEQHQSECDSSSLTIIGKKAHEYFRSKDYTLGEVYRDMKDADLKKAVVDVMRELVELYTQGEVNRVYLAYNQFASVMTQVPTIKQVLPLEPPAAEAELDSTEFLFEPSSQEILSTILPKYVENQAYTSLLDNVASEHGSRMTAMDSATNNANDLIDRLQLQYNRARQTVITTELTEIVSGAEAING